MRKHVLNDPVNEAAMRRKMDREVAAKGKVAGVDYAPVLKKVKILKKQQEIVKKAIEPPKKTPKKVIKKTEKVFVEPKKVIRRKRRKGGKK